HRSDRFDHAADLRASGDMAISSDLRATAYKRMRVHHGVFVHIRADVDKHGRHADDAVGDKAAVADAGAAGNEADAFARVNRFNGVSGLVQKRLRRRVRPHLDDGANAEPQEKALLYPSVYAPAGAGALVGLRGTYCAAIQSLLELLKDCAVFVGVAFR